MKKLTLLLLATVFTLGLYSCGDDDSEETTDDLTEESTDETAEEEVEEGPENPWAGKKAVALRSSWLSDKAGGNKQGVKWISKYSFGNTFEMTGDTAMIGKTIYYKLKAKDGKEGWTSEWSCAPDARVGVTTKKLAKYDSPDITSVSTSKVDAGLLVAVLNNEDEELGFVQIFGEGKKLKAWVKEGEGISSDATDLEIAGLLRKIKELKTDEEKVKELTSLTGNSDYASSPLLDIAKEWLNELDGDDPVDEMLMGEEEAAEEAGE